MKLSTNHELMEATATQYDTAHISSFFSRPRTDLEEGFEPQNSQRVSTLVIFYYINLTMAPIQPIFERARGNFIVFFFQFQRQLLLFFYNFLVAQKNLEK